MIELAMVLHYIEARIYHGNDGGDSTGDGDGDGDGADTSDSDGNGTSDSDGDGDGDGDGGIVCNISM